VCRKCRKKKSLTQYQKITRGGSSFYRGVCNSCRALQVGSVRVSGAIIPSNQIKLIKDLDTEISRQRVAIINRLAFDASATPDLKVQALAANTRLLLSVCTRYQALMREMFGNTSSLDESSIAEHHSVAGEEMSLPIENAEAIY
jgi:hypothetical protein